VHVVGLHKIATSECSVVKPFVDNGRFKMVNCVNVEIPSPGEYTFGPMHSRCSLIDPTFRTCFGPLFLHDAVIYGDTPHNLSLALTRLTAIREPTKAGYDRQLRRNQKKFIDKHRHIATLLRHSIAAYCVDFKDVIDETLDLIIKPHPKKKPRLQAWKKLVTTNKLAHDTWMSSGVSGKVKKNEFAKPGKYPRLINDLTIEASLLGAFLTSLYKHALEHFPIHYRNSILEFIATPNHDSLSKAFENLIHLKHRVYMCYFSDDSCVSLVINGEPKFFNLDISSCDTSHTSSLFSFLESIFVGRARSVITRVVNQCRQPLRLSHKNSNGKARLTLKPTEPVLYSGSTLTTLINNVANILIGISVVESSIKSTSDIIKSAERAGYIITIDNCPTYHHLQFLKHSPVLDQCGSITPMLNLGVVMRSIGRCKGIIPGKGPLVSRFRLFNGSLAQSLSSGASHRFIKIFRSKFPAYTEEMLKHIYNENFSIQFYTKSPSIISDCEVARRYTDNIDEFYEMCEMFSDAPLYSVIDCPFSRKVFLKDYGYLANLGR
jgi:hypothetical protein